MMNQKLSAGLAAAAFCFVASTAPATASAQSVQQRIDRRQQTKNEWRNIAIGSGALSVIGLLNNDKTLVFAGAAGALYSVSRYEQDRKSQSKLQRLRAQIFSKPYFYRNGKKYVRRTKWQNGKRYFYFARA